MSSSHFTFMDPVPSDIDVSQSIPLAPIGSIAEAVGCLPTEYDLYGSCKAKIHLSVRERLAGQRDDNAFQSMATCAVAPALKLRLRHQNQPLTTAHAPYIAAAPWTPSASFALFDEFSLLTRK